MSDQLQLAVGMIEAEARKAVSSAETIEDKLRAAFKAAKDHWMFTDENIQQRAGIGAALIHTEKGSEDFRRVEKELKLLNSLGAAVSGVPVDFTSLLEDEELEVVGIKKIWDEV